MSLSLFKIGIILGISGIIWISIVFFEGNRTTEEFLLESLNSHSIKLDFVGKDIGYYKVFMSEFAGEKMFVQILDHNGNIISEQSVQTKMSVEYFDFDKSDKYSAKITNISENPINLQFEFGNTNSQNMIPAGIILLVGVIIIIISSYMKLKNYRIAQPDENIS